MVYVAPARAVIASSASELNARAVARQKSVRSALGVGEEALDRGFVADQDEGVAFGDAVVG